MIERHEIENDLLGEIADYFTSCGDLPRSYAGLVIERARHHQGAVVLHGYDRASSISFTATAHVQVLVEPRESCPASTAVDEEQHNHGEAHGRQSG